MPIIPRRKLLTRGDQGSVRRFIDPARAAKFWLESGSSFWFLTVTLSVSFALLSTAAMEMLLHGQVTSDFLLTALVSSMFVSAFVIAGLMWLQAQMRLLEKNRQEAVAKNQELNASRQRYRTLIEVANDAIFVANARTGLLEDCNRQAEILLGKERSDILGEPLLNLYESASPAAQAIRLENQDFFLRHLAHETITTEFALRRADGSNVFVESSSTAFEMEDQHYIHCALRDISERKRAEVRLRLLANAFEYGASAILVTDRENRIIELNPAFTELSGYALEDVRGKDPRLFGDGRTPSALYETLWAELRRTGYWQGEVHNLRQDGSHYIAYMTISLVRDEQGAILYHVGSYMDITQRRLAEDRIKHLAHHDALTNLPNRTQLQPRLEEAIAMAQCEQEQVAVMFIDLDNFKKINDSLGHRTGDILLQEVARRLVHSVRPDDVVARLGGDEFVIVIRGAQASRHAATAASRILGNLHKPFQVETHHIQSGASVGIALYPTDGNTSDTLMKNADIAMYNAKAHGRNTYRFFCQEMQAEVLERVAIENDLRRALGDHSFQLVYQPQVELATGRVCGVEALLRWTNPSRREIATSRFIQIAEETKLILPIGAWVLNEACRQQRVWREQGISSGRMAVNVSMMQLHDSRFVQTLKTVMQAHELTGADIELEITESAIMEDFAQVQKVLLSLRDIGVGLSIDDFGTGYSSLSRLNLLPIQRLKIEQSFVRDLDTDATAARICGSIIALARGLGIKTVAEGVETEAQSARLRKLKCDEIQGYLIARPLPADDMVDFIAQHDQRTREPENQRTREPENQRTREPENQRTREPENQVSVQAESS